jgi:tetratricopeptide (TPR) repeat protein/DNA-binding XRE family transcriptional regulator
MQLTGSFRANMAGRGVKLAQLPRLAQLPGNTGDAVTHGIAGNGSGGAVVSERLGAAIRSRRVAAGLTQEELAERSGLTARTIRNIERGHSSRPYGRSLDLVTGVLGLAAPAAPRPLTESSAAGGAGPEPVPAAPGAGPAGGLVPRQLPVAIRHFAGRATELAVLDRLLGEAGAVPGLAVISAIGGTVGVGKTSLAVYWGHRVAARFPDGQLYVNLRGFDPSGTPVPSATALRGFLSALGVRPGQVPASPDAAAGLYRSVLAGRRILIVLDNARDAAQVRPLLPGSETCFVIVTSRSQLTGLAAGEGAHLLGLDVLSDSGARELLTRRLGPQRARREPAAVRELARLCARLPLALAIAAARAAAGPSRPLAALAEELRDAQGRLDALDAGEAATSLRAVFSWSYQSLSDPAARMFRLLGVHPGPDFSAPAAASLAGQDPAQARAALQELAAANLLTAHARGRFGCHDLLRAYAGGLAMEPGDDGGRRAALHRVLDHYLQAAWAAERLLQPASPAVSAPPALAGVTPERIASYGEALHWIRGEHQVLLAAIGRAVDAGFDRHAWQLACALRTYYSRQGSWPDWAATAQLGLSAARRAGDLAGQAHGHRDLALARLGLGSYPDARAHQRQALDLYRQLGDDAGQGHSRLDAARILEAEGQLAAALRESEQALGLFRQARHCAGEASALSVIGWYHARLGQPRRALRYCQPPIGTLRQLGDRDAEASAWERLGYAWSELGHHVSALACYRSALGLFGELEDRYRHALMLVRLGDTHEAAGDRQAARDAWQQALAASADLSRPDATGVRARLRAAGPRR